MTPASPRPARRSVADVRTGRFERSLSAVTAAGAAITAAEIYLSHDGASFGNKMMWWPVVIVPTAIPAGIAAVFSARAARTVLPLTSAAIVINGVQGTYLHWRGIAQRPGGWTRYNMEAGPPMFAPLLASLVGGMGLVAAVLRRERSAGHDLPRRPRSGRSPRRAGAGSPASTSWTRPACGTTSPPGWCWPGWRRRTTWGSSPRTSGRSPNRCWTCCSPRTPSRGCRCSP